MMHWYTSVDQDGIKEIDPQISEGSYEASVPSEVLTESRNEFLRTKYAYTLNVVDMCDNEYGKLQRTALQGSFQQIYTFTKKLHGVNSRI